MRIHRIQAEVRTWADKNFGTGRPVHHPLLGAVEELGELAHAHLKGEQGIRGTREEMSIKAKDAVGDVIIYLMDYCNLRGWDISEILDVTWEHVKTRDWKGDARKGGE